MEAVVRAAASRKPSWRKRHWASLDTRSVRKEPVGGAEPQGLNLCPTGLSRHWERRVSVSGGWDLGRAGYVNYVSNARFTWAGALYFFGDVAAGKC